MKPSTFDPKAGSLQLAFSNGNSYSFALSKTYHREQDFYVDLFWDEKGASSSLSLALHPKADNLILDSCKIEWKFARGFPTEVYTNAFNSLPLSRWERPEKLAIELSFLEKHALKKLNGYAPLLTHAVGSYQSISLRNEAGQLNFKSIDESAALTVFTLSQNKQSLYAENQCAGYHLRHSFPAFELQFDSKKTRASKRPTSKAKFSIALSPKAISESSFQSFTNSSLIEEGNLQCLLLKKHEHSCPDSANFDASFYAAFAKTCIQVGKDAGIEVNPFVVRATSAGHSVKAVKDSRFRRWSPSLESYVYPLDLTDEETLRSCEQHLLRFYQLGYRYFILQDVALSLKEGLKTTTTGQQLSLRLSLLKRALPNATLLIADLSDAEAFEGFQGFKAIEAQTSQLPWIARLAGLGHKRIDYGKLTPYRVPVIQFASSKSGVEHTLLDLTRFSVETNTMRAVESTLGSYNYPK